ncbi:hypothetical protein QVD17_41743 [Tagetes erecta]|uniref:DUF7875 domain-containing protein n=1 Tax=Tagetes erecta TaxID=13708 RepID=A0AAD8JL14_TARER|nr:hypothetical protein QVD17_41743 [Tagetes erecta]
MESSVGCLLAYSDRLNLFVIRPVLAFSFILSLLVLGWFLAWKLLLVHVPLVQEIFGLKKKRYLPKPLTHHRFSHFYNTLMAGPNFFEESIMALRRLFGFSDGELMRSDSKPCSRLTRHTAGVFSVGGALGFWILCRLHYGPRVNIPPSLRWAGTGALTVSASTALLVCLFSPECEPRTLKPMTR